MPDAASSFLNQPLRSESQARAARELAQQEHRRRLEQHGTGFCRKVLAGAFERVYQADGSYRLRDIQSGAWLEDLPPTAPASHTKEEPSPVPPTALSLTAASPAGAPSMTGPPSAAQKITAARQFGYASALRDLSHWISDAAGRPRLDADTLAALNDQIAHLSRRAERATISGARGS